MATPTKKQKHDDTVTGYIHSVSPVKLSSNNTQMFNAVIQTSREEFHDAVVFSPPKRRAFLQAAEKGTAVCLQNVKKTLSFRNTSDFDVLVSSQSDITVTTVPFVAKPPPTPVKIPLSDISTMPASRKIHVVEAKVIAVAPTTRTITVRGSDRELKNCTISDGTQELTLHLWEKHISAVELDRSYRFTELSTRSYKDKVELTTTFSTEVHAIDNLQVPDAPTKTTAPELTSMTGTVIGVEVKATMQCSLCSSKQDTFEEKSTFHRCQQCRLLQKSQTYSKILRGTLTFSASDEQYTLKLSNAALVAYFKTQHKAHLLVEDMEEHFLTQENFVVTYDNELNVSDMQHSAVPHKDTSNAPSTSSDILDDTVLAELFDTDDRSPPQK